MTTYKNLTLMFKSLNKKAIEEPEFIESTRIGRAYELIDVSVRVTDTTDYVLLDPRINRISYDYAETFWNFMISGGTDAVQAFERYPQVAQFIAKPRNPDLPENFNTFYGPRIAKQLPAVLKELSEKPNTRRASIMILNEDDLQLLDKNETLEFPCTIAFHFTRRGGKLILSTLMRSQNLAVVFQLDLYLQMKLLHLVAEKLNIKIKNCEYHCHMINAHVFDRDMSYVEAFLM